MNIRRSILLLVLLLADDLFSSSVSACPFCHTETGREVRAEITGVEFWPTLGALCAPFVILGAGLVVYNFLPSKPR